MCDSHRFEDVDLADRVLCGMNRSSDSCLRAAIGIPTQVILIDLTILIDDEGHHSQVPILAGWVTIANPPVMLPSTTPLASAPRVVNSQ
jgi:hypothetical protein